jgi:hypothetical protein
MAVGTQVERREMPFSGTRKGTRKWIAAVAIGIAAIGSGTGIYAAVTGKDAPASTPVVSSPEVPYVDPGVEARQDALKRFHEDNASPSIPNSDPQAALKRFHLDSKG